MKKMTMFTLTAMVCLAIQATTAAASEPPAVTGTTPAGDRDTAPTEHPCFRVPLNWNLADSGPLPTCTLSVR